MKLTLCSAAILSLAISPTAMAAPGTHYMARGDIAIAAGVAYPEVRPA